MPRRRRALSARTPRAFPRLDLEGIDVDPVAPFLPYRDGRGDPELAARYEALGELGANTFGQRYSTQPQGELLVSTFIGDMHPDHPMAWERGAATSVDVLDSGWDFWAAVQWPLAELRREHGVSPVDPSLVS